MLIMVTRETLAERIRQSGLTASEVARESGGLVSLNQASQWLNFWATGRVLSNPVMVMLWHMADRRQQGVVAEDEELSAAGVARKSVPVGDALPCIIYFLLRGSKIMYVGQSVNGTGRIAVHRQSKEFDRVLVMEVPKEKLSAVEAHYIKKFRPEWNTTHNRGKVLPTSELQVDAHPSTDAVTILSGSYMRKNGNVYFRHSGCLYAAPDYGQQEYTFECYGKVAKIRLLSDKPFGATELVAR